MVGPTQTREIGHACRLYKNSDDKVIAMDRISIVADTRRVSADNFHRSARVESKRILFHLGIGDRVVAIIQMMGDYSSLSTDAGNYLYATWPAETGTNDVEVSFNTLSKLGDTV